MNADDKIKKLALNKITTNPGVYQFFDSKGEILYIGKAKNLRSRVKSYFLRSEELKNDRSEAIYQMVNQISKIKVVELDSEIEALLLESELINKLKPKYNSRQKDDKSFYLIQISREDPQKIKLVRSRNVDIKDKKFRYFGPYLSGDLLKRSLKILRKIFPYPDCSKTKYSRQQKEGRGCLYFDLGLCLGPCKENNFIENRQQINYLSSFLLGRKKLVIRSLKQRMAKLSKVNRFEHAAKIRDQIFALEHLNRYSVGIHDNFSDFQANSIFPRIEAYDVSNIGGDYSVGAMTVATLGEVDKSEYKKFKIKTIAGANDIAMMSEVIRRRFKNSWPRPNLIVIDGGATHLKAVKAILFDLKIKVPLVAISKGPDRKKDDFHFSSSDLGQFFKGDNEMKKTVIRLRDEAHRFSLIYYRQLHRKGLLK